MQKSERARSRGWRATPGGKSIAHPPVPRNFAESECSVEGRAHGRTGRASQPTAGSLFLSRFPGPSSRSLSRLFAALSSPFIVVLSSRSRERAPQWRGVFKARELRDCDERREDRSIRTHVTLAFIVAMRIIPTRAPRAPEMRVHARERASFASLINILHAHIGPEKILNFSIGRTFCFYFCFLFTF